MVAAGARPERHPVQRRLVHVARAVAGRFPPHLALTPGRVRMAIRTLWMDSDGEGAVEYYAREFRDLTAALWDPGVIDIDALRVVERGAGANMTVTITGPGRCVIESSYAPDMGSYLVTVTADEEDIAISAAPGSG